MMGTVGQLRTVPTSQFSMFKKPDDPSHWLGRIGCYDQWVAPLRSQSKAFFFFLKKKIIKKLPHSTMRLHLPTDERDDHQVWSRPMIHQTQ